jgi:CHAT domain-containing protein
VLRDKRRWVVAPDGPLAFVAFDALPWHGRRVFDSHLVSQIQSLSVYALLQQRARARHAGTLDLIAMGAPDYLHVSPRRASDAQWPALAGAEREVRQVAALFAPARSRVALHGQASEASLQELEREGTLAHARRLLFATHAFVDAAEPMRSAVVLSRARDDANDGYVTAAKWTGYHLRSDLIVLSACDTASGGLLRGEGVMGLPFALLVAGNRDALLTLARVDDEAAAAFVPAFFRHVRAGADNALALALTKREFHRHARYRDPRYWAPFVLYGG